ncbi:hypothetical protein A2U01_0002687, partial [Trifolium medium]|nr:hypothetical protein [Trifolium medium]
KARSSKFHRKEKEKVAYVETSINDDEYDINYEDVEDNEVNVAELKSGPPYTWTVQKALNEGRLKFDEKAKPQMKVDSDPLQVAEASYVEPFECLVMEAMEVTQILAVPEEEYTEKIKVLYPQAEEELVDFLNRCKLNNKEVMLCPRCSVVCDK